MKADELKRIAGREKVPLGTIEKDYVITLALREISSLSYMPSLVFKGGTCLKKIYFPQARFSVDLDLTCLEDVVAQLLADLGSKLAGKVVGEVQFLEIEKEEERGDSVRISMKHRDFRGHPTSLKLDLSLREDLLRRPKLREVLQTYGLPPFQIMAMSLEEILAEKIRAIIARGMPRDVYDVWFLLRKGVSLDLALVNEKLRVLKRDRVFKPSLFNERLEAVKEEWRRDLITLLPEVPPFEQVKSEILKRIEDQT